MFLYVKLKIRLLKILKFNLLILKIQKSEQRSINMIFTEELKGKQRMLKIYNLLERIEDKDKKAEEELIEMFLHLINKYAMRTEHSEDCKQELIIEFWKLFHTFSIDKPENISKN